jgi:hypothetical protein
MTVDVGRAGLCRTVLPKQSETSGAFASTPFGTRSRRNVSAGPGSRIQHLPSRGGARAQGNAVSGARPDGMRWHRKEEAEIVLGRCSAGGCLDGGRRPGRITAAVFHRRYIQGGPCGSAPGRLRGYGEAAHGREQHQPPSKHRPLHGGQQRATHRCADLSHQ